MSNGPEIANKARFLPIPDLREWYPALSFGGSSRLRADGEPLFVTDPIYLSDVYNPSDDPVATYIKSAGVIVCDFGGDTSCPVVWRSPYLVLPTSAHIDLQSGDWPPRGSTTLADHVGCDSASFLFLVMRADMPREVQAAIQKVLEKDNGAILSLPSGTYSFWLEQFEGYRQANMAGLYRNIVAERT